MHTVTWLAPAFSSAALHTLIHFFPSAGNVAAPYPIHCRFRLFGEGGSTKPVTIEGPRLSNPDGVWLHQVFPELEGSGQSIVGIEVALTSNQPRINLNSSSCYLEFASHGYSCRFRPQYLESSLKKDEEKSFASRIAVKDAYTIPSVLIVNGENSRKECSLRIRYQAGDSVKEELVAEGSSIAPLSAVEVPIPEKILEECDHIETSWGLVRSCGVDWCGDNQVMSYLMHRSALTRVPLSVRAL